MLDMYRTSVAAAMLRDDMEIFQERCSREHIEFKSSTRSIMNKDEFTLECVWFFM